VAASANSFRSWREPPSQSGVAGVFIETHDRPEQAISDGPNMVPLAEMPQLLRELQRFDALAKELPVRAM